MTGPEQQTPIAIVAGGGALPFEVANALTEEGREFVVLAVRGEADPELEVFQPYWLEWGQIGKFFDLVAQNDCREMVLIGSIAKRPDFRTVKPDLGALKRLPRIIAALVGGDDSVMRRVVGLFEREGLTIVAAQDVAPQLLAASGAMTQNRPDKNAETDIDLAMRVIETVGRFDIGQGAVVSGRRVIAIEGAEGTDSMLKRCAELRRLGRISWRGRQGVLVKRTKPGQELRTDLPAIGPDTIALASAAGLAGIAVEAGGVLIAQKTETIARAEREGMFVAGVEIKSTAGL